MRAVALIAGVALALAGLVTAQDQLLLWQQAGSVSPIRLGALWAALGGASAVPLWSHNGSGIEAWLMDLPLSTVLPVVGAYLAWIGMGGAGRISRTV
jgi:hypothetical protein